MSNITAEKIHVFRNFANDLSRQVVDQLCSEYEREVSAMWNDLVAYRNELGRVAELLGSQLGRERTLHEMLEGMAGHQANIKNTAQMMAQQSPSSKQLHDLVDQILGQNSGVINSTLHSVNQAHAVALNHAASAKQLQEPLISAENEYNRIMSILAQPMIPGQAPQQVTAEPVAARGSASRSTPPMTPTASASRGVATPAAAMALPTATVTYVSGPTAGQSPSTPRRVIGPHVAPYQVLQPGPMMMMQPAHMIANGMPAAAPQAAMF